MNDSSHNLIEHYLGVLLRFDLESSQVLFIGGQQKPFFFPSLLQNSKLTINDIRSAIDPDDLITIQKNIADSLKDNTNWCVEYRIVATGQAVWVREQSYLTQVEGRIVIDLFIDDVTQFREEKQNILSELDNAKYTAENKNEFFASMSHEIRTPMNAVMGMAQILSKTALDIEQQQYVNTIIGSSTALVQVINDLLEFSKIEAGKIELVVDEVDLESLCLEICHLHSPQAQQKGLEIYLDFQVINCKTISIDQGRLRQILINLLGNAIKFTDSGYVELVVENKFVESENLSMFKFSIKDTGIGIDSNAKRRLFEAYSQADERTSQKFGGTGLGLQICQRLVSLMGGEIDVESVEGLGSNFWFMLPAESRGHGDKTKLTGKSFLLISNDQHNNKLIEKMILQCGARIDTTAFSDDAFMVLSGTKAYDIFIVDNTKQETGYLRIFRHIQAQQKHKNTTTIMLTDIGVHDDQNELFDSGVDAYIPKPVSPSLINKAIEAVELRPSNVNSAIYITNENSTPNGLPENVQIQAVGKILIAEDVEVNQVILTSMLAQIGLVSDIANNGKEAVDMVRDNQYDLVFMDCRMPIMDGFEATKNIRKAGKSVEDLTIIALTANARESDKQVCLNAGMNDYLSKPYTEKDLLDIIVKWLDTETVKKDVPKIKLPEAIENDILDNVQFDSVRSSLHEEFSNFALDITDKFILYQQEIISALKNGNMKEVHAKAHSLVGVASMIGAKQISEIARAIEDASEEEDLEKSVHALTKLDAAISKTHSMIMINLNPELEKSLLFFKT